MVTVHSAEKLLGQRRAVHVRERAVQGRYIDKLNVLIRTLR